MDFLPPPLPKTEKKRTGVVTCKRSFHDKMADPTSGARISNGRDTVRALLREMEEEKAIGAALLITQRAIESAKHNHQPFLDTTVEVFTYLTENLDHFTPEQLLAFWPLVPSIINYRLCHTQTNIAARVKHIQTFLNKMSPTTDVADVLYALFYDNASRGGISIMRSMLKKGFTLWGKDFVSLVVPNDESESRSKGFLSRAVFVARELEGRNAPPAKYVAESGALFRMMMALTQSAFLPYNSTEKLLSGYFGAIDTVKKITKAHMITTLGLEHEPDDAAALAFSRTFCDAMPCWGFLVITSVLITSVLSHGRWLASWWACAQLLRYMAIAGPQTYALPVLKHNMPNIVFHGPGRFVPRGLQRCGVNCISYGGMMSNRVLRLNVPKGASVFSVLTGPSVGHQVTLKTKVVILILPILRQAFLAARLNFSVGLRKPLPVEIIDIVWLKYLKACGMDTKETAKICVETSNRHCKPAQPCSTCKKMLHAPIIPNRQ